LSIRWRSFLTLAALCTAPLLVLSLGFLYGGLKYSNAVLQKSLEHDTGEVEQQFKHLVSERNNELVRLANIRLAPENADLDIKNCISTLPSYYGAIAIYDKQNDRTIFADRESGSWIFSNELVLGAPEPEEWSFVPGNDPIHKSIVHDPRRGDVLRYTLPLPSSTIVVSAKTGQLVADLKLSEIFSTIDSTAGSQENVSARWLIVLDDEQRIVYHPNQGLRNQAVSAIPALTQIGPDIIRGDSGVRVFKSAEGDTWNLRYQSLAPKLSFAAAHNYSLASQGIRRAGWLAVGLSLLLGVALASIISKFYQRKSQSLEQITAGVTAIAQGNLDQELLLRSSDDLRVLADNVNLMTERMREQLAREAETRQFNSFVRLSAMLAHDLKNAIEGLSLMVGNMEKHFDKPQFRVDAMNGLTAATVKLKNLVSRLSNPVTTMSGEFRMPRRTDLVPLLMRMIAENAEPHSARHQIVVNLPKSLFALADAERVEKVMENLLINAVEAMNEKPGTLTITAGTAEGKAFFSVTDTGQGMSEDFLQHQLFRPFSTTKIHGIGLGLYTCREVIRANGGNIEVESELHSGTTFRVVLASA
jgi:signal transduction histidine kinase